MDNMENKLGAILNNPALMQQIMSLAQNMGQNEPPRENPVQEQPNVDFTTIQKLAGLASESRISQDQQNLLRALRPYLSNRRINKLEQAMQAAKMANLATSLLGNR